MSSGNFYQGSRVPLQQQQGLYQKLLENLQWRLRLERFQKDLVKRWLDSCNRAHRLSESFIIVAFAHASQTEEFAKDDVLQISTSLWKYMLKFLEDLKAELQERQLRARMRTEKFRCQEGIMKRMAVALRSKIDTHHEMWEQLALCKEEDAAFEERRKKLMCYLSRMESMCRIWESDQELKSRLEDNDGGSPLEELRQLLMLMEERASPQERLRGRRNHQQPSTTMSSLVPGPSISTSSHRNGVAAAGDSSAVSGGGMKSGPMYVVLNPNPRPVMTNPCCPPDHPQYLPQQQQMQMMFMVAPQQQSQDGASMYFMAANGACHSAPAGAYYNGTKTS